MSEHKELGRIMAARFGWGGYQEAMIGVSITLGGASWSVDDFDGGWAVENSEQSLSLLGQACLRLRDTLKAAHKSDVAALVGVPVEATFEGSRLKSWRVLTEVLSG